MDSVERNNKLLNLAANQLQFMLLKSGQTSFKSWKAFVHNKPCNTTFHSSGPSPSRTVHVCLCTVLDQVPYVLGIGMTSWPRLFILHLVLHQMFKLNYLNGNYMSNAYSASFCERLFV